MTLPYETATSGDVADHAAQNVAELYDELNGSIR